jgi:hypothetical protein
MATSGTVGPCARFALEGAVRLDLDPEHQVLEWGARPTLARVRRRGVWRTKAGRAREKLPIGTSAHSAANRHALIHTTKSSMRPDSSGSRKLFEIRRSPV